MRYWSKWTNAVIAPTAFSCSILHTGVLRYASHFRRSINTVSCPVILRDSRFQCTCESVIKNRHATTWLNQFWRVAIAEEESLCVVFPCKTDNEFTNQYSSIFKISEYALFQCSFSEEHRDSKCLSDYPLYIYEDIETHTQLYLDMLAILWNSVGCRRILCLYVCIRCLFGWWFACFVIHRYVSCVQNCKWIYSFCGRVPT